MLRALHREILQTKPDIFNIVTNSLPDDWAVDTDAGGYDGGSDTEDKPTQRRFDGKMARGKNAEKGLAALAEVIASRGTKTDAEINLAQQRSAAMNRIDGANAQLAVARAAAAKRQEDRADKDDARRAVDAGKQEDRAEREDARRAEAAALAAARSEVELQGLRDAQDLTKRAANVAELEKWGELLAKALDGPVRDTYQKLYNQAAEKLMG